jgi:hypothetical protein
MLTERRHVACDELYSPRPTFLKAAAAQFGDPKHGLSDVDTRNFVSVFAQFDSGDQRRNQVREPCPG